MNARRTVVPMVTDAVPTPSASTRRARTVASARRVTSIRLVRRWIITLVLSWMSAVKLSTIAIRAGRVASTRPAVISVAARRDILETGLTANVIYISRVLDKCERIKLIVFNFSRLRAALPKWRPLRGTRTLFVPSRISRLPLRAGR